MRYSSLQAQARAARRQQALSQAALATRSGTSRVTIARFEGNGDQDIRLGTLERICQALELELALLPRGRLLALDAGLARAQDTARRLDRRRRHAVLAARLLAAPPQRAAALVAKARAGVDRWERERLCSRHYISRWRRMLSGPVRRVARALHQDDAWTDALFQNSPWGFALEAPGV